MKLKIILSLLVIPVFIAGLNAGEQKKRPVRLLFYIDSHLTTTTIIEYDRSGEVQKMSSFERGRLTDYAKYQYDSDNHLSVERTFDPSGILTRTRKYIYDDSGLMIRQNVYSSDQKPVEYLLFTHNGKALQKIDYYKTDNILHETIEFIYSGNILRSMVYTKIGKYIMVINSIYNKDMLLTGHDIKHSSADVKISTEYIYEDGFATEQALQLIFR